MEIPIFQDWFGQTPIDYSLGLFELKGKNNNFDMLIFNYDSEFDQLFIYALNFLGDF